MDAGSNEILSTKRIINQLESYNLAETGIGSLVEVILQKLTFSKIILLKGELGSGKTTLAKHLIKQFGINDTITSPTFNIISEYKTAKGDAIYHFDLYRIKSIEELYEIGFEEIIDSGNICIIEWPEIATPLLTESHIVISISQLENMRHYAIDVVSA